jgi:hypothetical protein
MNPAREVIYSITLHVQNEAMAEWQAWMLESHIPEVMATGCFEAYEMRRQLHPVEESRTTFEIRYLCRSMDDYLRYQETHAQTLQAAHLARFTGRFEANRKLFGSMEKRS